MTVFLIIAWVIAFIAWVDVGFSGRRYRLGGCRVFYFMFFAAPLAILGYQNALIAMLLPVVLFLPVIVRAVLAIISKRELFVSTLEQVDGHILTYRPGILSGSAAKRYWLSQAIPAGIFMITLVSTVFAERFSNDRAFWNSWVSVKTYFSPDREAQLGEQYTVDGISVTVDRVEKKKVTSTNRVIHKDYESWVISARVKVEALSADVADLDFQLTDGAGQHIATTRLNRHGYGHIQKLPAGDALDEEITFSVSLEEQNPTEVAAAKRLAAAQTFCIACRPRFRPVRVTFDSKSVVEK